MKKTWILFAIFLILNQYIMAQDNENKEIKYLQDDSIKLCYHDTGSGNTTIVLVSGLTFGLETWKSFQERLSKYARVISYDRNGLGNSVYIPGSKNIGSMIGELGTIMHKPDINTPVILVGHSIGGHIVKKYTELFPEKVKALFLIDAFHERFYKELKDAVTEKMWIDYVSNWESIRKNAPSGVSDEIGFNLELMKSDERYPVPSDIPVYLFTSIKETEIEEKFVEFNKIAFKVHLRLNNQLEKEYKNIHHLITDNSSHFIYLDEPELIVDEILKLVDN